ncbi:MAG: 30S ribosomal protein S18 [Bacteroidota bacterium]
MRRPPVGRTGSRDSRTGGPRGVRGPRGSSRTQQIRKKRVCRFCETKDTYIEYKNEKRLQRFISEQGRIIPKRITGTCSRHQRMLVQAIKRARHLALLPYVSEAVK